MPAPDHNREALRLFRSRDWSGALREFDRVLAEEPRRSQACFGRAQCLLALGRRAEAIAAAGTAFADPAADAVLLDALGSFYSFTGDQPAALAAFDRAAQLEPANAHHIFNRATVRRFLGEASLAEADYDRVIALRPNDFEAYKNRSDLRTQTRGNNHVAELERVAARGFADWRGEVQIEYALAKELEDLGNHRASYEHLAAGAGKRREHLDYDVANDVATVQWIIDAYPAPAGLPHTLTKSADAAPIFIVGLPRSGTTLVDRILGSHSQVRAAGELNDFAQALVARVQAENGARRLSRHELVTRSADIDFAALGREYLARAHAAVGGGCFTDKMPLNYLYCGIIRRALPEAKIVHLTRHPMAAGYAMLKTLFKDGYPFSYDLSDIARYYAGYRRLMDHWDALMPGVIHHVAYEALVADQVGETRRLLDYCELEWQSDCLEFHRHAAATTTASASQIRRPIYDSSVAQWRHYATELEPLRERFTAAGIQT